ncbi:MULTISPECIES: hypothetical protein [Bacillus cereus group]|uniref:Group-specific protein n=1 Tax=Bacillus cereus TaxID=1396 RepID=A0AA44Q7N0_BACCE|nr:MULTISPECIES: hypothetical protein [Bacillus cereus group]EEL52025.1 hypothetical protein bcere0022_6170 [Bacillus cereus Rock3-44]PFN08584.1 hypothetical protein COJ55_06380 [Bacillus cereus]PFR97264.1 hypothetical protein COK38_20005 [Bacillus cereus]PGZ14887.1 hypothetical protein COE46_17210 [Bacillus cereus]
MDEGKELTLICVGEKSKVNSLRELAPFQSDMIIFAVDKYVADEVRACGFESTYCCNTELNIPSICSGIKKVILLGDELPIVSFFTERIRFSFQAPITVVTRNKRYPVRLYQTIGAKFVVFTNCDNISFLFFE